MSQEQNKHLISDEDQVTQDLVNEELSDDELEAVSGGFDLDEPKSTGTKGGLSQQASQVAKKLFP